MCLGGLGEVVHVVPLFPLKLSHNTCDPSRGTGPTQHGYIAWRSWMMPDLIGGFNVNEKYDRLWQSSSRMVENKNIWTCQCDMSIWYHYDDVWMPLTSQWSYENELNTQFECSHGLVWGVCVRVPDSEISKKCPSMSILEGLCMWKKKSWLMTIHPVIQYMG